RKNSERAIGAVYMEPEFFLAAEFAQRGEIVDRADVDRAGRADDKERREPGLAVRRYLPAQCRDVDAVVLIDRDVAQRVAAKTRDIHRLGDAAMRGLRRIRRQQRA